MSGGVKISLNAIGPQDQYIKTSNTNNSFFRDTYKKHSNFANCLVSIEPTLILKNNAGSYKFGETLSFNIEKVSDLLVLLNIEFQLESELNGGNPLWEDGTRIVPETLFGLIEYIELVVGDITVQRMTGDWMYIWSHFNNQHEMGNLLDSIYASKFSRSNKRSQTDKDYYTLFMPLPFYFYDSKSSALPLWAIQHQSVKVNLKLRNFSTIAASTEVESNYVIRNVRLLGEFVELDQDEKHKFQNMSLEYCIDQVEFCGENLINAKNINKSMIKKIKIPQYNLVNELIWVFRSTPATFVPNTFFNYWLDHDGANRKDHSNNTSILLNGRPINPKFPGDYYRTVNRYEHHNSDIVRKWDFSDDSDKQANCIYCHSFSLNPSKVNSNGFLSLEKFNDVELDLKILATAYERTALVFVKHSNLIRIKNGYLDILSK